MDSIEQLSAVHSPTNTSSMDQSAGVSSLPTSSSRPSSDATQSGSAKCNAMNDVGTSKTGTSGGQSVTRNPSNAGDTGKL